MYNRKGKKDYLKNLEEVIEEGGWKKMIIGGDLNARTAEEGSIAWNENENEEEEEERRHSKDKIINEQGKDLLACVEELGLGILNGNKQGDERGEITFIGKKGSSVIDYAICNAEAWEEIQQMKIGDRTESDHRPIEVTLGKTIIRKIQQKDNRGETEDWSEKGHEEYKQKLKERVETESGAREEWAELAREIKKAVPKRKIKRREMIPRKRTWWDKECRENKVKLNKALREMIKGKIERETYLEIKRRHAKLCKEKQEEEKEKLMEIKDRNEVLKYIKREKQQRETADESIEEEEWIKHFMNLLEGEEGRKIKEEDGRTERQGTTKPEELKISKDEIDKAIGKLKKRKAAREDGIRNEAWIYADEKQRRN